MSYSSKIISVTLPEKLLAQIDQLAKRELATRSDIIRQATLKYVRESGIDEASIEEALSPKSKSKPVPATNIQQIAEQHPWVNPGDIELLQFLDDRDHNRL